MLNELILGIFNIHTHVYIYIYIYKYIYTYIHAQIASKVISTLSHPLRCTTPSRDMLLTTRKYKVTAQQGGH